LPISAKLLIEAGSFYKVFRCWSNGQSLQHSTSWAAPGIQKCVLADFNSKL